MGAAESWSSKDLEQQGFVAGAAGSGSSGELEHLNSVFCHQPNPVLCRSVSS